MKNQYQNMSPTGTCDAKNCSNSATRWVKSSGLICCVSKLCYAELAKQLKLKKLKLSDELH